MEVLDYMDGMTKLYGVDKFRVQEEIKLKFVSDVKKKILEIFK